MNRKLLTTLWVGAALVLPAEAYASPFVLGNVFASVANGDVREYTPTGTLVQTMHNSSSFTTGTAFDAAGNLYVTDFGTNLVSKFSNSGVFIGTFGSGYSTPESIVFNAAGEVFVGSVGGLGFERFSSTGTPLQNYAAGRVDWMDLNATQDIMYYTTEGSTINRWNLTTNSAMTPFASGIGPGEAYALRILGDNGVLLADGDFIRRFNSSGVQTQTYDEGANDSWFALNLDPDGVSFWSGDFIAGRICHFNIATGAVIGCFNTGTGSSTLFGLSVFGEITQGAPKTDGAVPEPATFALLGTGLALLLARARRRAN